jgi:hypothetical protein
MSIDAWLEDDARSGPAGRINSVKKAATFTCTLRPISAVATSRSERCHP